MCSPKNILDVAHCNKNILDHYNVKENIYTKETRNLPLKLRNAKEERKKPTFNSSLGITSPQPSLQCTGFLGLCSHSARCVARESSFTTVVQPYNALSQVMVKRDSKLRKIRGTGFSWLKVIGLRSTGQVGCRVNHS